MQVWYDPSTKEVKAVYSDRYTGTAWTDAGHTTYEDNRPLPKAIMPGAVIDFNAEGRPVVVTPPPEPPPAPDPSGFIQAGIDALGEDRSDELLSQYPTFLPALERKNWALARRRLDKALADGAMSQAEYDALIQLLTNYNIPEL